MTCATRSCSSAAALSTTAGGVARIARIMDWRASLLAAQKKKSDLSPVSKKNVVPAGVRIGGPPAGRGAYAAGTSKTKAVLRSGCLNANCMDDGAPAEA